MESWRSRFLVWELVDPQGPVSTALGGQLGGPELPEATSRALWPQLPALVWTGVGFSGVSCGPRAPLAARWTTAGCLPPWPLSPPLGGPWLTPSRQVLGAGSRALLAPSPPRAPDRMWWDRASLLPRPWPWPGRAHPHSWAIRQRGEWRGGQGKEESESILQTRKLSQESGHPAVQAPGVQPQPGRCQSDLGQLLPADPPQRPPPGPRGPRAGPFRGSALGRLPGPLPSL